MRIHLSKKEMLILLAIFLVIVLVWVSLFFFLIQPKKRELQQQEIMLQTEQQTLMSIQSQLNEVKNVAFKSSVELQKSVPVKPLLEKLILDIEKAEIVSDSFVKEVTFGEGIAVELPDEEMDESQQSDNEEEEAKIQDMKEGEEESQEEVIEKIPLPEGVEKIVINIEVETKSYEALEKFIKTLERSERIIVVENIDFSGTEEVTSEDDEVAPLTFSLTVSAFYMPTLIDLMDHLPQIEAPEPSKKENPFILLTDAKTENN